MNKPYLFDSQKFNPSQQQEENNPPIPTKSNPKRKDCLGIHPTMSSTMTSTVTSTTATTVVETKAEPVLENKAPELLPEDVVNESWYSDLVRDGYAVVKGAIPRERALQYASDMYSYLENFNLGFDRNDPSTIHKDNLPVINEKGMCIGYGVSHEDFTWKVRSEPGVIGAFEKVYQDKDLIVSFDAVNMSFPNRGDIAPNKPWPHQDQDPKKPGFRCLQGYDDPPPLSPSAVEFLN